MCIFLRFWFHFWKGESTVVKEVNSTSRGEGGWHIQGEKEKSHGKKHWDCLWGTHLAQRRVTEKEVSEESPAWQQADRRLGERPGEVITMCTLRWFTNMKRFWRDLVLKQDIYRKFQYSGNRTKRAAQKNCNSNTCWPMRMWQWRSFMACKWQATELHPYLAGLLERLYIVNIKLSSLSVSPKYLLSVSFMKKQDPAHIPRA